MKNIFYAIFILFVSCEVAVNKQNNKSDIENAKQTSSHFYELVKTKKFKEAATYFGETVGYEDGLKILENVNLYVGDLDSVAYLSGNSNTTLSNKKNEAEFVLNFKAYYSKMEANEEMVIELANDSMKVTGYHPRVKVPLN